MPSEMTAEEFNTWREYMGHSQKRAGEELGVSTRQVAYYQTGDKPIPRTVALACQALEWRHDLHLVQQAHGALHQYLGLEGGVAG